MKEKEKGGCQIPMYCIYILDNRYDQHDGEDGVICLGVRRT